MLLPSRDPFGRGGHSISEMLGTKTSIQKQIITRVITWAKPDFPFHKLNTDGVSKGNPGLSSAGGILRDHHGHPIFAFCEFLGHQTNAYVENHAIWRGLELCLERGFRQVWLEVDSMVAIQILNSEQQGSWKIQNTVQRIKKIGRNMDFKISHIFREGYAKWGEIELCLDLFKKMLEDSCSPDRWTLSAIMNACAEMSEPCYGHMLHGFIIQSGWNNAVEVNNSLLSFYIKFGDENEVVKAVEAVVTTPNEVSRNAIIDAYMKIGDLQEAYLVFKSVPEKNLISWTSMINGYMRNGYGERALLFFVDMMRSSIQPDDVTLGAVLHTCSNLATLGHGRMVHGRVIQSGFHAYSYVGNSLVNMYAKCGDVCNAHRAFNSILDKDLISWNTMLFAFGLHGRSAQTLRIFEEMLASGMNPDKVTFVGLLMTCSHLGLIDKGIFFFELMTSKYGLPPYIYHVACVVDMLARGGKLEKAKEFASKYVGSNNVKVSLLEALIGSYSCQGELTMGADLAEELWVLKPRDDMSYVLLSNLYCASGQWEQAESLRKAMADRGVKKTSGCSWIEVRDEVRAFVAGCSSFPYVEEVYVMLSILECEIRNPMSVCCWDGIT